MNHITRFERRRRKHTSQKMINTKSIQKISVGDDAGESDSGEENDHARIMK